MYRIGYGMASQSVEGRSGDLFRFVRLISSHRLQSRFSFTFSNFSLLSSHTKFLKYILYNISNTQNHYFPLSSNQSFPVTKNKQSRLKPKSFVLWYFIRRYISIKIRSRIPIFEYKEFCTSMRNWAGASRRLTNGPF